jgi:Fe-S oxidoreductase
MKNWLRQVSIIFETWLVKTHLFNYKSEHQKVFFPGCSLVSGSPDLVNTVYEHLKKKDPDTGIWLDCCGEPLALFVSKKKTDIYHEKLAKIIRKNKITEIITACGNCQKRLEKITENIKETKITFLYDNLAEEKWVTNNDNTFNIHHPCPARSDKKLAQSALKLSSQSDIKINSESQKQNLLSCCLVKSDKALKKRENIKKEPLLTYCGHCTKEFGKHIDTTHLLQVLFNSPHKLMRSGKVNSWKTMFKYKKSIAKQK